MNYRAEIDGLRALAVIPVILYHAGIAGFSGGFVGVDIFFVLSGYLISSILLHDLAQGQFSLGRFYERRARRILPALFLVLLVCLPLAGWLLLPHEWVEFGQSLIAVNLFASNILFWLNTDYFAATAETIPLLHTWSLAVEEQFYVLFPLLLWWLWAKARSYLWPVMGLLLVLSLGFSEWFWRQSIEANFFLLPSRMWELLLGVLCALYLQKHTPLTGLSAEIMSVAGLIAIVTSITLLHSGIPFPSVYTLIPTLGTVALILSNSQTLVSRLLSTKVLVGIGLISYSAYLWHQPLFVFARLASPDTLSIGLLLGLCVLTLVLAYASWRWVEQPFRQAQRVSLNIFVIGASVISLSFIALGLAGMLSEGFPQRFD